MKKQFLKTALITMAVVGVMSGSALALPMLVGGLGMTGSWTPVDVAYTPATIPDSTGIDFGGYLSTKTDNTFQVVTATGDFDIPDMVGAIGTIKNFQFATPSTPVGSFWTVGDFSFDMNSLSYKRPGSNTLVVTGLGTMKADNFDDTPGSWILTSEGAGSANFAWSASSASSAPVPEPATMLLFGSGLLGLAFVGRKMKK